MKMEAEELADLIDRIDHTLHDWVIIAKCRKGTRLDDGSYAVMEGGIPLIYLPERSFYGEATVFGELVAVGDGCKVLSGSMSRKARGYFGETVILKEIVPAMQEVADPFWAFKEEDIIPVIIDKGRARPLGDWMVLEMERYDGFATSEAHEWTQAGKVLEMGPDCQDVELIGERVMAPRHMMVINSGGKLLGFLQEEQLLGVLEPDAVLPLTSYK